MEPFRGFDTPGMPLFAISPERANRQGRIRHTHPHTPVVHPPGSEKSEFAYSWRECPTPNLDDDADEIMREQEIALRKAMMGWEEAAEEAKKGKEEVVELKKKVEEGKERERIVGEKLDVVMEELQSSKETHARSQTLYEKEVRRTRKEAFKASSTVVKLQEELKSARSELSITRSDLDLHRVKVSKREQETFEAQYKLVGAQEEIDKLKQQDKSVEEEKYRRGQEALEAGNKLVGVQEELEKVKEYLKVAEEEKYRREQEVLEIGNKLVGVHEELEKVKEHLKVVEEEKEALKTSLKEEEVARIAAEGKIALPSSEVQDEFSSPKKTKPAVELNKEHREVTSLPKETEPLTKKRAWDEDYDSDNEDELTKTQKELERERKLRKRWHDQIEYMKMECQFKMCSCRRAEKNGETYVHDNSLAKEIAHEQEKLRKWRAEQRALLANKESSTTQQLPAVQKPAVQKPAVQKPAVREPAVQKPAVQKPAVQEPAVEEPLIQFSPVTGTFKTVTEEEKLQPEAESRAQTSTAASKDARPELMHSVSAPLPEDISHMSLLHAPHLPKPATIGTVVPSAPRPGHRRVSREEFIAAFAAGQARSRPSSREAHTGPRRPLRPTGTNRPPSRDTHNKSTLGPPRQFQPTKGIRVVNTTTTTTVPLAKVFSPPTMTREEALEQIKHRRERAKSCTAGILTPRRQMVEGATKRDISAPTVGTQTKSAE